MLILIVLVSAFFLVPSIFRKKEKVLTVNTSSDNAPNKLSENNPAAQLFAFDPNKIDSAGWKKLGLRDKTVQTILHYRAKGGRFRKPEDIRKVYGLHEDEAARLIPYVHVEDDIAANIPVLRTKNKAVQYSFPLEINKAGADHWAALPGISPSLARRIVHYRDAMHGFRTVEQVGKTYGLSPETFAHIKPLLRLTKESNTLEPNINTAITEKQTVAATMEKAAPAEKLNINTASESELLAQKRIPRNVAKAIVIYREQHGTYQQVADVKKIVFINDEMYARIEPYLKVD